MRKQFMKTLTELAGLDNGIVLLYGDIKQCMDEFQKKFPNRIYNMGLAEQSMISIAAGMALEGLKPVVYSFTSFLSKRALEQIFLDVDQQNAQVILVGYDSCYPTQGSTHNREGIEHISRIFKNMKCYFPQNSEETIKYLLKAYRKGGPAFFSLRREL